MHKINTLERNSVEVLFVCKICLKWKLNRYIYKQQNYFIFFVKFLIVIECIQICMKLVNGPSSISFSLSRKIVSREILFHKNNSQDFACRLLRVLYAIDGHFISIQKWKKQSRLKICLNHFIFNIYFFSQLLPFEFRRQSNYIYFHNLDTKWNECATYSNFI